MRTSSQNQTYWGGAKRTPCSRTHGRSICNAALHVLLITSTFPCYNKSGVCGFTQCGFCNLCFIGLSHIPCWQGLWFPIFGRHRSVQCTRTFRTRHNWASYNLGSNNEVRSWHLYMWWRSHLYATKESVCSLNTICTIWNEINLMIQVMKLFF